MMSILIPHADANDMASLICANSSGVIDRKAPCSSHPYESMMSSSILPSYSWQAG